MTETRRGFVKLGGALGVLAAAGLLTTKNAVSQQRAWNKAAFEAKTVNDAIKALGGTTAVPSRDITITAPDLAENGAAVSVGVSSAIPKTEAVYILVEKNANVLTASFNIPAGTEPSVSTKVKMGQTSNVHAVVRADGKFYVATKEVKVTLGGCGG